LTVDFGNGFSRRNLTRSIRFAAEKGDEQVELLQLDKSGIRVASSRTDLPPRQLLRRRMHETLIMARAHLAGRLPSDPEAE
jgi:hypothetical protein